MKKITLSAVMLLLASANAFAARYYVDKNATGTNNGQTWTNAFTTIESAFAASIIGDEIWVSNDVYLVNATLSVPNGVKLYGGFAGTEALLSERDLSANITTLNGDIGTTGVPTDNVSVIMRLLNSSSGTRVDGFKFINGYNNSSALDSGGSAITSDNSSATVENCQFLINHAKIRGGAVHVKNSGSPKFLNCEFRSNTVSNNVQASGGAMFINSGNVTLTDCKFIENSSLQTGGGISAFGGTITMDRTYISGNSSVDEGGAIYIGDNASFNATNALIVGNSSAATTGATIYMNTTFNTFTHSFANCTIASNKTTASGTTNACQFNTGTTISNSIFWDNVATAQIYTLSTVVNPVVRYCTVQGGYTGVAANNILSSNPTFGAAGTGASAPFSHESFNYSIPISSTAANSGNNAYTTTSLDIAKNARISQTTVDRGCYESATLGTTAFAASTLAFFYNNETKSIDFQNAEMVKGKKLSVYDLSGKLVHSAVINANTIKFEATANQVYIFKVDGFDAVKQLVK
ncbi:hypothetical protein [Flavobacterium sp.]|uniref:hypothetical protein n=1 Tax=Flavobacterium sp. TaxID=239 RepID=UPI0039E4BBE0